MFALDTVSVKSAVHFISINGMYDKISSLRLHEMQPHNFTEKILFILEYKYEIKY